MADSKSKLIKFVYGAKDRNGKTVTGTIEAANEDIARQTLEARKLAVITVEPVGGRKIFAWQNIFNRVGKRDIAVFARQLATMISAGFPLVQALRIIVLQTSNPRLKKALEDVVENVERGISLSTAFSKHLGIFDRVVIAVVRAGESSGTLARVLSDLAKELEREASFTSELYSALAYPVFVFSAMIIVGFIMMVKVIPQLEEIFSEAGAQLPWATRAVIAVSHALAGYWYLFIILAIIVYLIVKGWLATDAGKLIWAKMRLKIPIVKGLEENVNMLRLSCIFSLLIRTGIPIVDGIRIVSDVVSNEVYKRALDKTAADVERGVPMSVPIGKSGVFPAMIGQMISVGEQTGKLEDVLDNLGKYYQAEVSRLLKTISALIEPVLIVVVGIGVGIIVFAVIVPIYQLAEIGF